MRVVVVDRGVAVVVIDVDGDNVVVDDVAMTLRAAVVAIVVVVGVSCGGGGLAASVTCLCCVWRSLVYKEEIHRICGKRSKHRQDFTACVCTCERCRQRCELPVGVEANQCSYNTRVATTNCVPAET